MYCLGFFSDTKAKYINLAQVISFSIEEDNGSFYLLFNMADGTKEQTVVYNWQEIEEELATIEKIGKYPTL